MRWMPKTISPNLTCTEITTAWPTKSLNEDHQSCPRAVSIPSIVYPSLPHPTMMDNRHIVYAPTTGPPLTISLV
ncbi:hypothetical protein DFH28DRAFT_1222211 [Melampsora americana]|nr:hypothetical protein DFH28DRAFT_1222211 [Melampsora americana]